MSVGSPGMESDRRDADSVLQFDEAGPVSTFQKCNKQNVTEPWPAAIGFASMVR